MKHKFLKNFDKDGNWTKPTRMIRIKKGDEIITVDMDEYAKSMGIELPDAKKPKAKKQINIDIVTDNDYADLEQPHDSGHSEIDGDGDSEGSE